MKYQTIDFETYYDHNYSLKKLTVEEYVNSPHFEVITIGVRDVDGTHHNVDPAGKTLAQIAESLEALGVGSYPLLAHNMAFDGAILSWKLGIAPPVYLDTMAMARPVLYPKIGSVGLGDIGAAFKGVIGIKGTEVVDAMGKRRKDFTPEDFAAYAAYCKQDCAMTAALFELLRKRFSPVEMLMIDRTVRMYTLPKLHTDRKQLSFGLLEEQQANDNAIESVAKLGLSKADVTSNPKFSNWLEHHGATVPMKVSQTTGLEAPALAKSDEAFTRMANDPNPDIATLVKARLQLKSSINETRIMRLLGINQRMWGKQPIPLRYYGTLTGRFSGTDKINMQNLPRGGTLRRALIAKPGWHIIAADQAQIEARINATISGQLDMVEAFRQGTDIYADMATTIYGRPISKEADPDQRFVGKTAILGCGYGVGHKRFHDMLRSSGVDADLDFAENVVQAYRGKYLRVMKNWWAANDMLGYMLAGDKVEFCCCTTGKDSLRLPNGFELYYKNLRRFGVGREVQYFYDSPKGAGRFAQTKIYGAKLVENVCQALTRILLTDQLVRLSMKYDVVHQLHDEIVLTVRTPDLPLAKKLVETVMLEVPEWLPTLPLAVEVSSGLNYAECK